MKCHFYYSNNIYKTLKTVLVGGSGNSNPPYAVPFSSFWVGWVIRISPYAKDIANIATGAKRDINL